mgnify:CR=1 FL=1
MNSTFEISQRQSAILAGSALLVMVAAVIFAVPFTINHIEPGDALATSQSIMESEIFYRLGNVGWLIVLVCDILVSWALYVYLKPISKMFSLLAAWFRLVYTAIFAVALINLGTVLTYLSGAEYLSIYTSDQIYTQVLILLNSFNSAWLFGLVFFGIHLFLLGYIAFKSESIPKILGILLMVASFGYIVDSLAFFIFPNYPDFESTIKAIVAGPNTIGELSFGIWLLVKGGKNG